MDRALNVIYFVTWLSFLFVHSTTGLSQTYCTGEPITENRPLCSGNSDGDLIRVSDVFVYDFYGRENRPCRYNSWDTKERLLDVSQDGFATIVKACDGRRVCQDFELADIQLSDGHTSNYVVMNYRCTQNTGGVRYFNSPIWLNCPAPLEIRVDTAKYVVYFCPSEDIFSVHTEAKYLQDIKEVCDGTSFCHNVEYRTKTFSCRASGSHRQSYYMAVFFGCIAPASTTIASTPPRPVSTRVPPDSVRTTATERVTGSTWDSQTTQNRTGATQQTSPGDSPVTQANQRDQSSGTVQGLYAGVAVAVVVIIIVVVVTVVCVKRNKQASKKTTDSPVYINQAYNIHLEDQVPPTPGGATDNVYTLGDEDYSRVGSAEHRAGGHSEAKNNGHTGTNRVHREGATLEDDYSLATAVDEYAVGNRQRDDPDELEIVDNVDYEPTPMRGTTQCSTAPLPDHDNRDHTAMVLNLEYAPNTVVSGDLASPDYVNFSGDSRVMDTGRG